MIYNLFLFLVGHAVCDYALQTDWIAKSKSRHSGPPPAYDPKLHGPIQKNMALRLVCSCFDSWRCCFSNNRICFFGNC